jgi:hypothetical protein
MIIAINPSKPPIIWDTITIWWIVFTCTQTEIPDKTYLLELEKINPKSIDKLIVYFLTQCLTKKIISKKIYDKLGNEIDNFI